MSVGDKLLDGSIVVRVDSHQVVTMLAVGVKQVLTLGQALALVPVESSRIRKLVR